MWKCHFLFLFDRWCQGSRNFLHHPLYGQLPESWPQDRLIRCATTRGKITMQTRGRTLSTYWHLSNLDIFVCNPTDSKEPSLWFRSCLGTQWQLAWTLSSTTECPTQQWPLTTLKITGQPFPCKIPAILISWHIWCRCFWSSHGIWLNESIRRARQVGKSMTPRHGYERYCLLFDLTRRTSRALNLASWVASGTTEKQRRYRQPWLCVCCIPICFQC